MDGNEIKLPASMVATDVEAVNEQQSVESVVLTISDALRKNPGRYKITGIIVSRSSLFNLITRTTTTCQSCGYVQEYEHPKPEVSINETGFKKCLKCRDRSVKVEHNYINAVMIWLEDREPKSDLERLPVVLFNKDNEGIGIGELVTVTGQLHIVREGRFGILAPQIFCEDIRYENREELTLTNKDVEAIKRFASLKDCSCGRWSLIDRLTSMVVLPVIGHKLPKQSILLAAMGTEYLDSRQPVLFAGDPGEAKSQILREGIKLIPRSKYVTAQYSTGKSMTAIIDKEGDKKILRYGPAAMAKHAFCAINEIGQVPFEDQNFLLDVMQEGNFHLNKYGFDKPIDAPTTILASTNPIHTTWQESDKISDPELPILKAVRDRFDFVFAFRRDNSPEANRDFAYQISERQAKENRYNYNFIKKYIHYARSLRPVFSDEAYAMLNEHWIQIATNGEFGSKRILFALYRTASNFARIYLKDIIDVECASQAIEFYNEVLAQYGRRIQAPKDPRELTLEEVRKIILNSEIPVSFEYAIAQAAKDNAQIKAYLGSRSLAVSNNKRARAIHDMIRQSPGDGIVIISLKPLVLRRLEEKKSEAEKPAESQTSRSKHKQRNFETIFKDLASQNDEGIVDHEELKRQLVVSGYFDAGEAHQIIKDNLASNRIFETLPYKYKNAD